MFLYALAGGVEVGGKEAWKEAIVPFLSRPATAFTIVLAVYLIGSMDSWGRYWAVLFPGVSSIALGGHGWP